MSSTHILIFLLVVATSQKGLSCNIGDFVLQRPVLMQMNNDTLLNTKEKAVMYAEKILFKTYGRKRIKRERPYSIKRDNGYWYITGTNRKGWVGGVFEIVLDAKNGNVTSLTHGK